MCMFQPDYLEYVLSKIFCNTNSNVYTFTKYYLFTKIKMSIDIDF